MAESRTGAGNTQDEMGATCARKCLKKKKKKSLTLMGICQTDVRVNSKCSQMAKAGTT